MNALEAAYRAHEELNEIRRNFTRACQIVQDLGETLHPTIFQTWLQQEQAAAARFEIAVMALGDD